jgi:hypothetical protein
MWTRSREGTKLVPSVTRAAAAAAAAAEGRVRFEDPLVDVKMLE